MHIYESEKKILDVLWNEGSLSASDLTKIMLVETGWSRNTTYTVIKKCIEKGLVSRSEPKYMCSALITKKQAQSQAVNDLLESYFANSPVKLISTVLHNNGVTKSDLKKIKKIINKIN